MEQESEVIELWPTAQTNSGIHLLIEWFGCDGAPALLREVAALRSLCLAAAKEAELPILAELFRERAGAGVTGTMLLAESHLTIHTWPVARSVAVDVFVGARARYNRAKAHAVHARLRDAMLPDKENFLSVNPAIAPAGAHGRLTGRAGRVCRQLARELQQTVERQ